MRTLAMLSAASLVLLSSAAGFAQEVQPDQGPPPEQEEQPPPPPEQQAPPAPPADSPVAQPGTTSGQWVYTPQYGWVWVPQGADTTTIQEQPYAYLYTPTYGWTWYVSPWGFGPFFTGAHAWYGARAWGTYFPGQGFRPWRRGFYYHRFSAAPVVPRARVVSPRVAPRVVAPRGVAPRVVAPRPGGAVRPAPRGGGRR